MGDWGGRRPGSGAKKKTDREKAVTGRVLAHPSAAAPLPEIEEFDAPNDLSMDERHVWMELAPHAFAARTLNKASSLAFRLLCRNVVREKALGESALTRYGADHRGLIKIVDAELLYFGLRPCGKAMQGEAAPQTAANPLDKYIKKGRGA